MECPICRGELADDAHKCWLVEEERVDPNPVCRSSATKMVGQRGALGRTVLGFKVGASKPDAGGLILRK